MALIETAFFVLFALLVYEGRRIREWHYRILWMSASWTTCEILRSEIPVFGLPWNLLAYSQTDYSLIRLSANAIGAYGLGFVIVWVNAALDQIWRDFWALTRMRYWQHLACGRRSFYELRKPFLNAALLAGVVILMLLHGQYHQNLTGEQSGSLRVAVIQGNIPQEIKWDILAREKILDMYMRLSELSVSDQPNLIVWPEAAFPGYFNRDIHADRVKAMVKELKIPFLIGSPHNESSEVAYNSAYMVNEHGNISGRYDKQYLVPFGEYVPLPLIFGWLKPIAYSLGVSDFYEGHESTVFRLPKSDSFFSTLICFEDVFPGLSRKFVEKGARFLLVITNDAWFMDSSAPYQHLQASVFRAVENGVPVVRAANTGISAFINKKGEVISRVQDHDGKDIFVTGAKTETIALDEGDTLYRSLGYLFPYAMIVILILLILKRKKDPEFLRKETDAAKSE